MISAHIRRMLGQGQRVGQPVGAFAWLLHRNISIEPFRALRPPKDVASKVASPPYDVLSTEEARVMAKGNSASFLRVNKPEIDLPPEISQYDPQVYQKGRSNLELFVKEGYLKQDKAPGFYIYSQKMGDHEQFGVCAGVPVVDYAEGRIKRHENTVQKKEDDRTTLTYTQRANVGPVFLMYRPEPSIDQLIHRLSASSPETAFTADDGIHHAVWPVTEPKDVEALREAFQSVLCSYIADGHHRSASAFRVGDRMVKEAEAAGKALTGREAFQHFLAVLFPAPQLLVMGYNRVVKDLNGLTADQFLAKVSEKFEVSGGGQEAVSADAKGVFRMFLPGSGWHTIRPKAGSFDADDVVGSLDVQVLYDNLLHPILGIGNPRTDERIKYVGGIRGMAELERLTSPSAVAFDVHPVSVEEIMAIADASALMPPKATWFEPKLRSGLIVRVLD